MLQSHLTNRPPSIVTATYRALMEFLRRACPDGAPFLFDPAANRAIYLASPDHALSADCIVRLVHQRENHSRWIGKGPAIRIDLGQDRYRLVFYREVSLR